MKATKEDKKKPNKFPCLMVLKSGNPDAGAVVLFNSDHSGMVVCESMKTGREHKLGYYSNCWWIGAFEPYTGKIVLED